MITIGVFFFFQAEDGIRDLVRSRGLGDVYKRQHQGLATGRFDGGRQALRTLHVKNNGSTGYATQYLSLIHI